MVPDFLPVTRHSPPVPLAPTFLLFYLRTFHPPPRLCRLREMDPPIPQSGAEVFQLAQAPSALCERIRPIDAGEAAEIVVAGIHATARSGGDGCNLSVGHKI